jgi:hypothetical protein
MAIKVLALAALLATQVPAESAEAPETAAEAASKAYWASLQAGMAASRSPRERAFAAQGTFLDRADDGALRSAAQSAPGDALVQMLWSTSGDGSGERARAWEIVEPGNGFAVMTTFRAEARSADDRTIDAGIARIAAAEGYDDHLVDYWRAYRRAIAARPMPGIVVATFQGASGKGPGVAATREEAGAIAAMARAAALSLAPIVPVLRACRRSDHPDAPAQRFEDCARIGRGVMASRSSVLVKMAASSIVRVSGLENDADREARRRMEWRQASAGQAIDERVHRDAVRQYFSDLDSTGDEAHAQELAMARYGIAMDPPLDWRR